MRGKNSRRQRQQGGWCLYAPPGPDKGAHGVDWDGHGGGTMRTREEAPTAEEALKDQAQRRPGGFGFGAPRSSRDPGGLGAHSPLLLVK